MVNTFLERRFRGYFYRPQRSWGKVMFLQVSVILSTGGGVCVLAGGACMVTGDMCGCWGYAWLLGGMHGCQGGVHGCWGACVVVGGVCGCRGACMVARGHVWLQGACMVAGGACIGYDEIQSMSGRYASYWNAFLFIMLTTYHKCRQFFAAFVTRGQTPLLTDQQIVQIQDFVKGSQLLRPKVADVAKWRCVSGASN